MHSLLAHSQSDTHASPMFRRGVGMLVDGEFALKVGAEVVCGLAEGDAAAWTSGIPRAPLDSGGTVVVAAGATLTLRGLVVC